MSSFEAVVERLTGVYLGVLRECLAGGGTLVWLALGHEQESWYFNYATESPERDSSAVLAVQDWLSSYEQRMFSEDIHEFHAPRPDGVEPDPWDEDSSAFKKYALKIALGEVALGIKERPERLSVPVARPALAVDVFDDIESSTFEARTPELHASFDGGPDEGEKRGRLVEAYAATPRCRQLLLDLWDGHFLDRPLLEVLSRQRTSREPLLADIRLAKAAFLASIRPRRGGDRT